MEIKQPNFIIVGAPKAGTSSLYHYLKDHPEIYLPEQKELHYWSSESLFENCSGPGDKLALNEVVSSWNDYCLKYQAATSEKQLGDVSPSYLYFYDHVIPEIKRKLPSVKIIIMLRDPVERAYSNYLHQQRLTYEKLTFSEALDCEEDRSAAGYSDFWQYTAHSRYLGPCSAYVDAFGAKNVHFLTFEELRDNPNKVMLDVFSFLDVDTCYVPDNLGEVFNAGGAYKSSFLMNALLKPNGVKSFLYKRLGDRSIKIYKSLKNKCLNSNRLEKKGIDPEVRQLLVSSLKEDVKSLSSKLGVNVKLWRGFEDV